jgi:curved DNA-binding protein CbpA
MEVIEVDGEYYDPYHILGVTKDDSMDIVKAEYKMKAKKYHPDKARSPNVKKYEKRFRIVKKAYNYIKERKQQSENCRESLIENSKQEFQEKIEDVSERLKDISDYEKFEGNIINQFQRKKFSVKEFNKLFEYNKSLQDKKSQERAELVKHKTSDGFFGYNSSTINNCALVSSFQGLMLTLDNDELGKNQRYDSYFNGAKNPNNVVKIPNSFEMPSYKKKEKQSEQTQTFIKKSFRQEEKILHDKMLHELVEKEEYDKNIICKKSKYDNRTIQKALRGELDMSPSLLNALNEHYNTKKLTY